MNRTLLKHKVLFAAFIAVIAAGLSSCGTLAGRSTSAMGVQSPKAGVPFEIVDGSGKVVASGVTPQVVALKTGTLGGNKYTIKYKKAGADAEMKVKTTLNGAALNGTLRAMGGFIVGLIIDPITGAMFKLPDVVTLEIAYQPPSDTIRFMIATPDDVRPEARQYLIPIGNIADFAEE
ncbi:MAG: hypothetical protein LBG79_03720 [Spirochaetaceae bacterium]|jgi:hypothetical protein|nr:hypothetical protein [Spirochaetaceae bacterium]